MLVMKLSSILFISSMVMSPTSSTYWWLGRASFGGRNYNLADIAAGKHTLEDTGDFDTSDSGGDEGDHVFNMPDEVVKHSGAVEKKLTITLEDNSNGSDDEVIVEEDYVSVNRSRRAVVDEFAAIPLQQIETECPFSHPTCTFKRLCDVPLNVNPVELVICLSHENGLFEICCDKVVGTKCPDQGAQPPAEFCIGEEDECSETGIESGCGENQLCCFNGCKNICLEDPPREGVDIAQFQRGQRRPATQERIKKERAKKKGNQPAIPSLPTIPTESPLRPTVSPSTSRPQVSVENPDVKIFMREVAINDQNPRVRGPKVTDADVPLSDKIAALLETFKEQNGGLDVGTENSSLIEQIETILQSTAKNQRKNPRKRSRKTRRRNRQL